MKAVLAQIRHHWFKAAALVGVLYVLIFHVEWDEFGYAFANVSWYFVLLAVLANFSSIILKAVSWKIIFDSSFEGIHSRWRDLVSAIMVGFLVNAIIPARAGELARAYVISRRQELRGHPVSRSTVFGTVVLERVFDGIVMAFIVIYGILRLNLPGWANSGAIVILAIAGVFSVVVIVLEVKREKIVVSAKAAKASIREHDSWWRKQRTRLHGVIARFSEGQKVLRHPVRVTGILICTAGSWTSQLFAVFFSIHAFNLVDETGRGLGLSAALLLLILINVAGALPATPGNVGIFQLATVIPLTVTYGISKTTALAFSIGLQVIEGSIGVGIGSACLLREGLKFGQVRSESLKEVTHASGQD